MWGSKKVPKNKIFTGPCKWVICLPNGGDLIECKGRPKKIAGGYMTKQGRRYIASQGNVRLILNSWMFV